MNVPYRYKTSHAEHPKPSLYVSEREGALEYLYGMELRCGCRVGGPDLKMIRACCREHAEQEETKVAKAQGG